MDPTIQLASIVLDQNRMKKFLKVSASPEAKALINQYGEIIIRESRPLLPHQLGKRYTKYSPLRDAFIMAEPKLKKVKFDNQTIETFTLKIKPKKNHLYYFVVMAGHAERQGKDYKFKYSNPLAITFPIEKTTRRNNTLMNDKFYRLVMKKVDETSDSDNKI